MVTEDNNDKIIIEELSKLSADLQKVGTYVDNDSASENQKERKEPKRNVILFFSFDIVNSTEYKSVNYYNWAAVINKLLRRLRNKINELIPEAEMWRILGDEVIFIVTVRDEAYLQVYVNKIFNILVNSIHQIKNGDLFREHSDDGDRYNNELERLQNILSLKAAAWIAVINDIGNVDTDSILLDENDNIFEKYTNVINHQPEYAFFEFMGNDIDAGFRISKQTLDGRFVLSYELAYLISKSTDSLSYLNIITYMRLKGIWKDKLYPIIWYHDPKAYVGYYKKEVKFEDSFVYDDCNEYELIKEYFYNHDENAKNDLIRDKKMFVDPYYALEKIKTDRGLSAKIDKILDVMKKPTKMHKKFIDSELMQIHCAAVCYIKDNDSKEFKILVFKRSDSRGKLQGKWEFGCAKAVIDRELSDRIVEEYKEDFNIDIKPICDSSRENKEPRPLALYRVVHEETAVSESKFDAGIIVLAEIIDDAKFTINKKKHSDYDWICESDVNIIPEKYTDTVPDFEDTIKKAFKLIHEIEKDGVEQNE